jgi:NAD(P)-dependent dehydrogenase (short-subunit alcohol dehydrogenase family)
VDLLGKSLVVVGGTSGVGLSAAKACLAAGANLVVVGYPRPGVERAAHLLGPGAVAVCAEPGDPATVPRAIAEVLSAFGRFDGLYHAIQGPSHAVADGPLHEVEDESWRAILDLHLCALRYSNRAAIRQFLLQRTGGAILNWASAAAGPTSPKPVTAHAQAAANAAVIGLSRAMASFYAPYQIRLNVLASGGVGRPDDSPPAHARVGEQRRWLRDPLGVIPPTADLDAAAVFLLGDGARSITGQVVSVEESHALGKAQESSGL